MRLALWEMVDWWLMPLWPPWKILYNIQSIYPTCHIYCIFLLQYDLQHVECSHAFSPKELARTQFSWTSCLCGGDCTIALLLNERKRVEGQQVWKHKPLSLGRRLKVEVALLYRQHALSISLLPNHKSVCTAWSVPQGQQRTEASSFQNNMKEMHTVHESLNQWKVQPKISKHTSVIGLQTVHEYEWKHTKKSKLEYIERDFCLYLYTQNWQILSFG